MSILSKSSFVDKDVDLQISTREIKIYHLRDKYPKDWWWREQRVCSS